MNNLKKIIEEADCCGGDDVIITKQQKIHKVDEVEDKPEDEGHDHSIIEQAVDLT
jgi:hypothetical protein